MMERIEDLANQKAAAVSAIGEHLDQMSAAGREPDQWERVFLIEAINHLFRGGYTLSLLSADLALTPAAKQSDRPNLQTGGAYDTADVDTLRRALSAAAAEPLREWPHFGPIVFKAREGK